MPPSPHLETTSSGVYAHTALKAVLTTAPADLKSRKAARMLAVKGKRLERKAQKVKEAERLKKEGVMINGHVCGGPDSLKKVKNERTKQWQQKKKSAVDKRPW